MRKRILILDDDKDILEILSLILMEEYEIKALNCGDRVFEEIEEFKPDLILMDVRLAHMDGLAICRDLKENVLTSSLPVILISATHDLDKSLNLPGAPNDYLAKPFDIDILLNKVEKHLRA